MTKKSLKDLIDEELGKPKAIHADQENDSVLYEFDEIESLPADGTGLYVFNRSHVLEAIHRIYNTTRKEILKTLNEEENWKPYATIQPGLFEKLDMLDIQFANFHEVIQLCRRNIQLFSLESPEIIRIPPLLLSGPPGVGKTRFMAELANSLGTCFFSLDFSTLSSGFVLTGGDSTWSDSKPGFISESIRKSQYANPIIMLDEIDKVAADRRYDPLGPLYGLLESHTATKYKDEYLGIPMNLSGVLWVATANYPERIPAPIRSRMIEIKIDKPSPEQSRTIVKSIYDELLSAFPWGKHFDKSLDDSVIDTLATLSPRLMKIELEKALANAASRAPKQRRPIRVESSDVQININKQAGRNGIGFMATFH